ncbi:hypothetical protein [Azospirillum palustre]
MPDTYRSCDVCGGTGYVEVRRDHHGHRDYLNGALTGEQEPCTYCAATGREVDEIDDEEA